MTSPYDPSPHEKRVARRVPLAFTPDFPGLRGATFTAREYAIEPFLVLTEFHMDRQVFGPHPHAGISVMTYILPESRGAFLNRDSQGDHSRIDPGALHITQAGRGIHHDEFPIERGVDAHGFQIWINHREVDREAVPKAMHVEAAEVPEVQVAGGRVRVLHGAFGTARAPQTMVTPVTLLHLMLDAGASIEIPADPMTFAYAIHGDGVSGDTAFAAQTLLVYGEAGDRIRLSAGSAGAALLVGSGTPLRESITYGGPFVATTPAQMLETQRRYARGEMGSLEPYRG